MNKVITDGWYVIFVGLVFAVLNFFSIDLSKEVSDRSVLFFLINTMLGVVFEEIVFRGIIQNRIVDSYKNKGKTVWSRIVVSSMIFGAVHLLNLIGRPYFVVGTITQVIYTFCLGAILGVVYYKSDNLNTVIFLHFVFNVLGGYSELFSSGAVNQDIPIAGAIIQLVLMLPCLYIAKLATDSCIE